MDFSLDPMDKMGFFPGGTISVNSIHRQNTTFSFGLSAESEYMKLKRIQLFLRQMKAENDTVHGTKIHFGKTDYRVFIDVLIF